MLTQDDIKVRTVRVRAVEVPMRRPLAVSTGQVSTAPLILVDLHTDSGPVGCSYIFVYAKWALEPTLRLIENFSEIIAGSPLAPLDIEAALQKRLRLIGPQGLTLMALAAIDMAAWDALAKSRDLPLAGLLGGTPQRIPAYNSNGLGIIGVARAATEAKELLAPGFYAVKVRLGYPDVDTDLSVVRAVRGAVGPDVVLMADYNQLLSVPEAIRRIRVLDGEQLMWVEEPIAAEDARGHAQVKAAVRTAIQTGENWWGPQQMADFLHLNACDYAMPDAMKIGGVSGWLRAAGVAQATGIPLSSHLYPEISAHLLSVTPTRQWLEYVDWAEPILREPVQLEHGYAVASDTPGTGIEWNEDAVRKYQLK